MPSGIARGIKPLGVRRKPQFAGPLDLRSLTIVPPYMGYCPDLNPSLTGMAFFEDVQGLINVDGLLTIQDGWFRLEDADDPTLPLGGFHDHTAPNDDLPGGSLTTPLGPADDGYQQPVILLCELSRSDGGDPKRVAFAATGLSTVPIVMAPAVTHGTSDIGFCWYLDSNNDWVNVPWDTVGAYDNPITNAGRDEIFDWAPYPIGGTTAGGSVNVGLIFFTNFVDQVYKWEPGHQTGAMPGEYVSAFGAFEQAVFRAKSVDLLADRLIFLHTEEGGDLFNKRARWTNIATTPDLTSAGSGFIDFVEFAGDGLRVLSFQDTAAVYFEDGVGFLWRTDNTTNPYRRTYLTKERGLLGPQAVTRVNNDLHFGIFEDGWFFLSAGGSWQEAGLIGQGGSKATKWSRKFYEILHDELASTITTHFDSLTRRIYVSFPVSSKETGDFDPDVGTTTARYEIWTYDLDTDSIWPDEPYNVDYWSHAAAVVAEGMQWDSPEIAADTWADMEGTWSSYAPIYGNRITIHGSEGGLVFIHSSSVVVRDGEHVNWFVETHKDFFQDQYSIKASDRLVVEHGRINPEIADPVGLFEAGVVCIDGGSASEIVSMKQGGSGRTTSTIHPQITNYAMGTRFSGEGAVKIYDWQLSLRPSMVPDKEPAE